MNEASGAVRIAPSLPVSARRPRRAVNFADRTEETAMPPDKPSLPPQKQGRPRQSTADRRAAEIAASAGKQAQLKQEAAERRAARERREAEAPPK